MRARRSACLATLLAAGCTHHVEEAGPPAIPYACADGTVILASATCPPPPPPPPPPPAQKGERGS